MKRCTCSKKCAIRFIKDNALVLVTLICVILGGCLGTVLRQFDVPEDAKVWIKIWGELFLRMLKMLILPLVMCSLITGVSSMEIKSGGRLGIVTSIYHLLINLASVVLGVIISFIIRPGRFWYKSSVQDAVLDSTATAYNISTLDLHNATVYVVVTNESPKSEGGINYSDIFADFLRNLFPDNIVKACLENVYTERSRISTEGHNGTLVNETTSQLVYRDGTNTMGVIVFSVAVGLALAVAKEEGRPLYTFVQSLSSIIFILLKVVIWYSPFGIMSLVTSSVMEINNIGNILTALSLYVVTFVLSAIVHMFVLIPLLYFLIVRKNPFIFFFKFVISGVIAGFGPPSSAAGVPVLMKTFKENQCVDQRVSDFFLPLAITISRSGSAMFIMSALLFVIQTYNYSIGFASLIVAMLLTSILVTAAAAVPSASIMILLTVASAVHVNVGDRLGAIMAMEWLMDRVRASNNLTSTGLGCVIVEKICKRYLSEEEKIDNSLKENHTLMTEIHDDI